MMTSFFTQCPSLALVLFNAAVFNSNDLFSSHKTDDFGIIYIS